MGVAPLFAALVDVLGPAAAAAAPEAGALGAATGAEIAGATALPEIAVTAPAIEAGVATGTSLAPEIAGGVGAGIAGTGAALAGAAPAAVGAGLTAADLIPEATGAGLAGLTLDTAGLTGGSALGPAGVSGQAPGLGLGGIGLAGAMPGGGVGGGFTGSVLGPSGQFGNLSGLLGPTDPLAATNLGDPLANAYGAASSQDLATANALSGVAPVQFTPTASQPGIVGQDFTALGQPGFLSQIETPTLNVGPTTPFAPADTNLAASLGFGDFPTPAAPQVADVGAPVSAANPLSGAQIGGAAPPPPGFSPFTPTGAPMAPAIYPTEVASPAAPAAETAATTAAAAAPAASPNLFTQYGPLALGGAGLGLNIARGLGTPTAAPTAAPIGQAPATSALAQTAPAMDAGQMKQLLLNEGMSPEQADQYIAQINARLASNQASGTTDALSSGLVTAG